MGSEYRHGGCVEDVHWFLRELRNSLLRLLASESFVLLLCALYFCIVCLFEPKLYSPESLRQIVSNLLPLLIVSIGQTVVLITAGIDLSVTAIIGFTSVTGAMVMNADSGLMGDHLFATPAGVLAMLLAGALVGGVNGTAIARFSMPPFMVTLTTMMFFSGFAIWLTQSQNIYNLPGSFVALVYSSIPYSWILTLLIVILVHLLLKRTLIGKWLYAVGINSKAAEISGVRVERTILFAYILSGICAAVASMLYTARLETGSPVMAENVLLDVVGAVVIGGTSLFGGRGKVLWTVYGVLFITILDKSLNMLGLSYFSIMMVKGLVILLAAFLDSMRVRLQVYAGAQP